MADVYPGMPRPKVTRSWPPLFPGNEGWKLAQGSAILASALSAGATRGGIAGLDILAASVFGLTLAFSVVGAMVDWQDR